MDKSWTKLGEGGKVLGIIYKICILHFPILYVGLAPTTFSHGLLPIGRKGDPSASADSDPASSGNGNRRKTQQNLANSEITRGPDTIDPVWLESLVNGGFNAAKAYFSSGEENTDTQGDLLKGIDNKTVRRF